MKKGNLPKVSLILTTYNCRENFQLTMESILEQDYPHIEIVVKDGGSTDGTLEQIKKYAGKLQDRFVWESGLDDGIYDAMNQGYRLSKGDVIAFFNDRFTEKTAVSKLMDVLEREGETCIGVHSDLVYTKGSRIIRLWKMGMGKFSEGWMPGHPTLYLKRKIYEQCGLYDVTYKCSGDYEFMIRSMYGREDKLAYVPEVLVRMYYGGISTGGLYNYICSLAEGHMALKKNGVKNALWIDLKRIERFLRQFKRGTDEFKKL